MLRKLIMSLTPVMAIAAFAVIPAVAQAAHWDHCVPGKGTEEFKDSKCSVKSPGGGWIWQAIPNGKQHQEKVLTKGVLTLSASELLLKIKCEVKDKGAIWNIAGEGKDSIVEFANSNCVTNEGMCLTPEIKAVQGSLPWPSHLIQGPPIRDVIEGIEVEIRCSGALADIFEGTLEPEISETNGTATFGTGSVLKDAVGHKGEVTGTDAAEQENGAAIAAQK
jgi:hypothetical protein